MRWIRFSVDHRPDRGDRDMQLGLIDSDGIVAVTDPGVSLADQMHRMLDLESLTLFQSIKDERIPLNEVHLHAPITPPVDIIAIGRNYAEHASEMSRATGKESERPTVFSKALTSLNEPDGEIVVDPKVSSEIDWEAELGVVVGRNCRDVSPEEALDFVFGYTVLNDVSARDIQYGWGGQFYKGKSIDGYCPVGPWIVTADEIPDPQNLNITLRVNGVVKQEGNTRDMIFPVAQLISQLSLGQTLRPGTLIATGTPPGVGYARAPREFLHPGDLMETEISGIGLLRNRVVASDPGIWEEPLNPGG